MTFRDTESPAKKAKTRTPTFGMSLKEWRQPFKIKKYGGLSFVAKVLKLFPRIIVNFVSNTKLPFVHVSFAFPFVCMINASLRSAYRSRAKRSTGRTEGLSYTLSRIPAISSMLEAIDRRMQYCAAICHFGFSIETGIAGWVLILPVIVSRPIIDTRQRLQRRSSTRKARRTRNLVVHFQIQIYHTEQRTYTPRTELRFRRR